MEVILGITIVMFLIAAYSVGVMVREANKMRKKDDPTPNDDIPGMFDDVEYRERPFINYN